MPSHYRVSGSNCQALLLASLLTFALQHQSNAFQPNYLFSFQRFPNRQQPLQSASSTPGDSEDLDLTVSMEDNVPEADDTIPDEYGDIDMSMYEDDIEEDEEATPSQETSEEFEAAEPEEAAAASEPEEFELVPDNPLSMGMESQSYLNGNVFSSPLGQNVANPKNQGKKKSLRRYNSDNSIIDTFAVPRSRSESAFKKIDGSDISFEAKSDLGAPKKQRIVKMAEKKESAPSSFESTESEMSYEAKKDLEPPKKQRIVKMAEKEEAAPSTFRSSGDDMSFEAKTDLSKQVVEPIGATAAKSTLFTTRTTSSSNTQSKARPSQMFKSGNAGQFYGSGTSTSMFQRQTSSASAATKTAPTTTMFRSPSASAAPKTAPQSTMFRSPPKTSSEESIQGGQTVTRPVETATKAVAAPQRSAPSTPMMKPRSTFESKSSDMSFEAKSEMLPRTTQRIVRMEEKKEFAPSTFQRQSSDMSFEAKADTAAAPKQQRIVKMAEKKEFAPSTFQSTESGLSFEAKPVSSPKREIKSPLDMMDMTEKKQLPPSTFHRGPNGQMFAANAKKTQPVAQKSTMFRSAPVEESPPPQKSMFSAAPEKETPPPGPVMFQASPEKEKPPPGPAMFQASSPEKEAPPKGPSMFQASGEEKEAPPPGPSMFEATETKVEYTPAGPSMFQAADVEVEDTTEEFEAEQLSQPEIRVEEDSSSVKYEPVGSSMFEAAEIESDEPGDIEPVGSSMFEAAEVESDEPEDIEPVGSSTKEQFIQQVEDSQNVAEAPSETIDVSIPYDATVQLAYEASGKSVSFDEFKPKYLAQAISEVVAKQPIDVSIPYDATVQLAYEASDKSVSFDEFKPKYLAQAISEVVAKQPKQEEAILPDEPKGTGAETKIESPEIQQAPPKRQRIVKMAEKIETPPSKVFRSEDSGMMFEVRKKPVTTKRAVTMKEDKEAPEEKFFRSEGNDMMFEAKKPPKREPVQRMVKMAEKKETPPNKAFKSDDNGMMFEVRKKPASDIPKRVVKMAVKKETPPSKVFKREDGGMMFEVNEKPSTSQPTRRVVQMAEKKEAPPSKAFKKDDSGMMFEVRTKPSQSQPTKRIVQMAEKKEAPPSKAFKSDDNGMMFEVRTKPSTSQSTKRVVQMAEKKESSQPKVFKREDSGMMFEAKPPAAKKSVVGKSMFNAGTTAPAKKSETVTPAQGKRTETRDAAKKAGTATGSMFSPETLTPEEEEARRKEREENMRIAEAARKQQEARLAEEARIREQTRRAEAVVAEAIANDSVIEATIVTETEAKDDGMSFEVKKAAPAPTKQRIVKMSEKQESAKSTFKSAANDMSYELNVKKTKKPIQPMRNATEAKEKPKSKIFQSESDGMSFEAKPLKQRETTEPKLVSATDSTLFQRRANKATFVGDGSKFVSQSAKEQRFASKAATSMFTARKAPPPTNPEDSPSSEGKPQVLPTFDIDNTGMKMASSVASTFSSSAFGGIQQSKLDISSAKKTAADIQKLAQFVSDGFQMVFEESQKKSLVTPQEAMRQKKERERKKVLGFEIGPSEEELAKQVMEGGMNLAKFASDGLQFVYNTAEKQTKEYIASQSAASSTVENNRSDSKVVRSELVNEIDHLLMEVDDVLAEVDDSIENVVTTLGHSDSKPKDTTIEPVTSLPFYATSEENNVPQTPTVAKESPKPYFAATNEVVMNEPLAHKKATDVAKPYFAAMQEDATAPESESSPSVWRVSGRMFARFVSDGVNMVQKVASPKQKRYTRPPK